MSGLGSPGIFTMVVKVLVCLVLWNALVAHGGVGGSDRMAIAPRLCLGFFARCSRRSSTSISVGVGSVEDIIEVMFPDSIGGDSIKCVRRNQAQ